MATFPLSGTHLDFDTLAQVFQSKQTLELSEQALSRSAGSPADLPAGARELTRAWLEAQAVNYGPETEENIIRLALLLLIHSQLTKAEAGAVEKTTLQRLLAFYNREVYPVVLRFGSDTTRLAQLCQPLLLSGKVRFQGYPLKAAEVSEMFSWTAPPLTPAQVQALLAEPVFSWAQTADVLMNLKPLTNWFIYFDAVFGHVLPDSNTDLHRSLRDLIKLQEQVQQALEQEINRQEKSVPSDAALAGLARALPQALGLLADLAQVLLGGLETMVEPPTTATFTLAIELTQRIALQAAYSAPAGPPSLAASLTLEKLSQQTSLAQTLASLVFWSFIQADALSGDFLESSTIRTYQQAGLFVPEETVTEQLNKVADFIQTHIPVGAS